MATPSKKTMFNYFEKLPSKTSIVEENPRKSAPVLNRQHVEEFQSRREQFEAAVFSDNENQTNYLVSLRSNKYRPYKFGRRPRGALKTRLLQFSEDVRPPYFGTWQKKSKLVTGRRPFAQDDGVFDYEVDSEAEWDIGGPGESLKGDDSEDEEEMDDYEIDMKTFVPHGYVSDDEIDVHSDNENPTDRSIEEVKIIETKQQEDSNGSVKIVREINTKTSHNQQVTSAGQPQHQASAPTAQPKQTSKMDIKPITLGLNFDENPTISEGKVQFLRAFEGVSCN